MKAQLKKKVLFIVFWTILSVSFVFSAFLIILNANGLQFNYKQGKIVQTGMIVLDGSPHGAKILVNGKQNTNQMPSRLQSLSPGSYEVEVSANGFQKWQKIIHVEGGMASTYSNIVLFLSNPTENTDFDKNLTADEIKNQMKIDNADIKIFANEIFYQEKLVTRFSSDVLGATLSPDKAHIVFQIDSELRAVELDGGNNTLLFTLKDNSPSSFIFTNNGDTLVYLDQGKIYAKNIR